MKAFFTWLILQCVFARILFGLAIELWKSLHFQGSESIGYFIVSAVIICLCETIVSGVMLFDTLQKAQANNHEMRKLEYLAAHPDARRGY